MSYNYDVNPWDDNYTQDGGQPQQQQPYQQQQQPAGGYAGYDPSVMSNAYESQYSSSYQDAEQRARATALEQFDDPMPEQQQQQPQETMIKRFLRAHIPGCGSLMDACTCASLPLIDKLVQHINRDLLVSKMFYFFFYSAFGSLFPLMGVYFKQLGMNPAQVGILTGVRPFIEIFSAPFWHNLADRFHKSKALLLFSVLSWIIFTYSLAHIRPPASACIAFNDTDYVLYTPYSANDLSNYESSGQTEAESSSSGGSEGSKTSNEMFLNKMPITAGVREGKEGILASEENQNDQRKRRRRRRRRQVDGDSGKSVANRFAYELAESNNTSDDEGYYSPNLEVDLENDFDDTPVKLSHHSSQRKSHFYDLEHQSGESADEDEFESARRQQSSQPRRQKRSRDSDDLLGESDEPEPEEDSSGASTSGRRRGEQQEGSESAAASEGGSESRDAESKVRGGKQRGGNSNSDESDPENAIEQDEQAEASGSGEEQEGKGNGISNRPGSGNEGASGSHDGKDSMASPQATMNESGRGGGSMATNANKTKRVYKQRHKTPPTHIVGMSPITVEYAVNYNKEKHSQFVTPMFSTIVYKLDDIKEVFFLLLLLISLGEFFSAPALTLADSATLGYLGDNTDLYGRQRMFGSLSWAVTLLLVGMALDSATTIADHPCGPHQRERSYTVCFVIFALLMACAFLTATQFRFSYPKAGGQTVVTSSLDGNNKTVVTTTTTTAFGDPQVADVDQIYASTQPRSIFNTAPPVNAPPLGGDAGAGGQMGAPGGKEKFEFLDKWKSAVFAQRTFEVPGWVDVFRQFSHNPLHLTYLFITWFLGCGVGLVFTFLFWHLQDVGGTPTLFGICSVINHISEILAYFFSFSVIKRFGHTKVLSVGLGCNVIRFLYVAFLTNPYYALPFEFVQGITHAACFAACCSYISHQSKPELRTSTQGVMQGLHHGIGRACGTILGGCMINIIGSRASFCIYGLLSGCVLAGFLHVRKRASKMEEAEFKVDNNEALGGYGAPQGVPSAMKL